MSGTPATGATYSTTVSLPAGHHTFAFYVTDGTNYWGDPPNDASYSGLGMWDSGRSRSQGPLADHQAAAATLRLRRRVSLAAR